MSESYMSSDNTKFALNQKKSIVFLWSFTKVRRGTLYLALSAILAGAILGVLSAKYLGLLVEDGLIPQNKEALYRIGLIIVAIEAISLALLYFGRLWLAQGAIESIFQIRKKLFHHLQALPMRYFDRQPLGRTVTRMTYDVESLEDFFQGTFARLVQTSFVLISVLVAMIYSKPLFGILVCLSITPAIIVTILFRKPLFHWNRELSKRSSAINAKLSELINGIPIIRSFGLEKWSQKVFNEKISEHLESGLKMNFLNAISRPVILFLSVVPIVMIVFWGGNMVVSGAMSIGLFITYIRYSERFWRPVSMIAQEIHQIQAAMASAERVTTFLYEIEEDEIFKQDKAERLNDLKGKIEFSKVSMSYDSEKQVLKDIDLILEPGEMLGLAGETGSGKTSTVSLLARLYPYQEGVIKIDGTPIEDLDRNWMRSQIGFVSQDVVIFKGSIRDNLKMGIDYDDTKLLEASMATGLHARLKSTGRNLDTIAYQHGTNLSAGEIQLLSLTRIMVSNPKILIMDEATANIDPELEELVHNAIHKVFEGRTSLIIAHRLSTLRNCDRICVFKAGRIEELGTHQQLLDKKGYYYSLIQKAKGSRTPEESTLN